MATDTPRMLVWCALDSHRGLRHQMCRHHLLRHRLRCRRRRRHVHHRRLPFRHRRIRIHQLHYLASSAMRAVRSRLQACPCWMTRGAMCTGSTGSTTRATSVIELALTGRCTRTAPWTRQSGIVSVVALAHGCRQSRFQSTDATRVTAGGSTCLILEWALRGLAGGCASCWAQALAVTRRAWTCAHVLMMAGSQ